MGRIKNTFTYTEFAKEYPNDDVCLEKIFQMTYGKMERCPKCKSTRKYVRVKGRRAYQCSRCYNQVHPTVGTVFERTRVPLTLWFKCIFQFSVSKNGMSAEEVSRTIGVSAKTALRMLKRIRQFIYNDESMLSGAVQIDETFVGGKNKNRHYDKKVPHSQGRAYIDKVPVLGMIEMSTGRAIAKVIPNVKQETLHPALMKYIERGSTLLTDEYGGYKNLQHYFSREFCNHSMKQYTSGMASTNKVENMWNIFKGSLRSYVSVRKTHLHLYLKEFIFKYNFRDSPNIFNDLLNSIFC